MSTTQSRTLKAAILTMSFVQMGTNGIAPILAQIAEAFPGASASSIQFLMTFPSIFCFIFTLLSALLAEKLPKKTLALTGLFLVAAGGILACLFHGSLTILFVWAAVLGIGIGMVAPIAPALISELFEGAERQTLMGQQNSTANIGSMLMTFFGGYLAILGWQFGYLVYLLGLPGFFLTLKGVPAQKKVQTAAKQVTEKAPLHIWKEMAIAFVFLMLFSSAPANLSMLISERGIGGSAVAGIMSTLFLLGGTLAGLLFGKVASLIGNKTIPAGCLVLCLGFLLTAVTPNAVLVGIGCLLAGASIGLVMPSCMMGASMQKGRETLASALVLGSSNIGVFIMPLLTTISAMITGSDATAPRFILCGCIAALLGVVTLIPTLKKN